MFEWLEHLGALQNLSLAAVGTAIGGAVAWWTAVRTDRRSQATLVNQLNTLVLTSSREQLEAVNRQLGRYMEELRILQEARFALEDAMTELRDMAITARTLVHEYERRLQLDETVFPPLPRPGLPVHPPGG